MPGRSPRESLSTLVLAATTLFLTASCGIRPPSDTTGNAQTGSPTAVTIGHALVETVDRVTAVAFGTTDGDDGSDRAADALYDRVLGVARSQAHGGVVRGARVPGVVPGRQLACVATVLDDRGAGGARVTTVQGISGGDVRPVPAVVQLAVSILVVKLANPRSNPLEPDPALPYADLAGLRKRNTFDHYVLVTGSEDPAQHGVFRVETIDRGAIIEVEWDPSLDDPSLPSRLAIRKGKIGKGAQPEWTLYNQWFPVPAHYLAATAPAPLTGPTDPAAQS